MKIRASKTSLAFDLAVAKAMHARDTTELFDNLASFMRETGMVAVHADIAKIPGAKLLKR